MSTYTIQTTWATGTTMTAAALNADPIAIKAALNNIDRTNMGTAGIDATSIIPGTTAAATFGGTVGYTFPSTLTSGTFTCTQNVSTLPTLGGITARFAAADTNATVLVLDTFGATPAATQGGMLLFSAAQGTAAAPTGVQNADILGQIAVRGRTSLSTYTGPLAAVQVLAEQAWGANNAYGISFQTGTGGSGVEALRLTNAGQANFAQAVNLAGAAISVPAGSISYGATTATSASAGVNGAVPAQVVGYINIFVGGTARKIPFFA